jgi:hypothetical protein
VETKSEIGELPEDEHARLAAHHNGLTIKDYRARVALLREQAEIIRSNRKESCVETSARIPSYT